MDNRDVAIVVSNSNEGIGAYETIDAIVNAGFKNVFIQWYNRDWNPTQEEQLKYVREKGLNIIFAHLGYKNINDIWIEGENGDILVENYKNDIRICKENGISTVVMHLIGGKVMPEYNELGLKRLQELADYAETLDVKIAIENTKRKEYLYYVIDNIKNKNVGVCFDSGHYHIFSNDDFEWDKVKDRIFAIHLHDNDKSDDLHLIPFDGTLNWEDVIMKLRESNYNGPITMESCYRSNYLDISIEEFYKRSYEVGETLKCMFELAIATQNDLNSKDVDMSIEETAFYECVPKKLRKQFPEN